MAKAKTKKVDREPAASGRTEVQKSFLSAIDMPEDVRDIFADWLKGAGQGSDFRFSTETPDRVFRTAPAQVFIVPEELRGKRRAQATLRLHSYGGMFLQPPFPPVRRYSHEHVHCCDS